MANVQLSAQGSVIKTAYEAEADTNAYNDAAVTKLAGIVPGVATTNVFKIPGSLARGDIFFIDVSGNLVRLPAGTNGHFLKTQSTTGDPIWEALPGGGDMLKATYDPDADGIFAIAQGGTGQATAQAAIDAISQVAGATNEHVLTKDTGTGNATWKVGGGGGVTDHGALTGLADDDHTQYLHVNGTRAMTGDLDMGNSDVINILRMFSDGDIDGLIIYGGDTAVAGSLAIYGKNHASVPGMVSLEVPDAAKAGQKWALRVYGVSDTPKVDIAFGIDMNSKKIESLLAGSAAADAVRYDQVMLRDGSQAMTADMDLGGFDVSNVARVYGNDTSSYIGMQGTSGASGSIYVYGKDHATHPGGIRFVVPNAGGVSAADGGRFDGMTNTPKLFLNHGLDMNSKKIESLLAGSAAADAVRYDQVMLLDGSQAMAGNLNMGDYLIDDVDDIQAYDIAGITVRNSAAASRLTLATTSYSFIAYADASMNTNKLISVVDPTSAQDASTKNYADKHIGGAAATELTIATGAVTITQSYHTIDTEADAASDDLDTISGGTAGQILVMCAANPARTVVVKDGGGIILAGDMSLDTTQDTISLIYNGTSWVEISRSNNGT